MVATSLHEKLAQQRQQELLNTAVQVRLARHLRARRARRLRTRAGWWLVQTGIRMVLTDAARSPEPGVEPIPT
jgi:hypothetical protein